MGEKNQAVFMLAVLIVVGALFIVFVRYAFAADATSADIKNQIRSDCRVDALHYCPKQSARCLLREDQPCLDAIIACMTNNKAKLKPNCQLLDVVRTWLHRPLPN